MPVISESNTSDVVWPHVDAYLASRDLIVLPSAEFERLHERVRVATRARDEWLRRYDGGTGFALRRQARAWTVVSAVCVLVGFAIGRFA